MLVRSWKGSQGLFQSLRHRKMSGLPKWSVFNFQNKRIKQCNWSKIGSWFEPLYISFYEQWSKTFENGQQNDINLMWQVVFIKPT